jgi:RHS repeat-associated protein
MSSPADASGCYGLSWNYDAWGNRLSQNNGGGSCLSPSHTLSAINRIIDTGYVHDAAGNMTSDNVHSYAYDAENRLTAVDGGATAAYAYDANGHRVQKIAGGATTEYVYDASGNVVAETNAGGVLQAAYSYLGDSLFAEYAYDLTLFVHKDHLGSTRVLTTYNTTAAQNAQVSDSMDYLPYGEQISGGSTSTHKFTGKEHDAESGLDDFEARYYSSALGRFISADWSSAPEPVPYADFLDPQSLNLYAYVRNLPTVNVDSDGHCCDIDPDQLQRIADTPQQVLTGAMKGLWNSGTAMVNGVGDLISTVTTGEKRKTPVLPEAKASNTAQKVGDVGVGMAMLFVPVIGELAEIADATEVAGVMKESEAFAEAAKGGDNVGFLKNNLGLDEKQLSKGIESQEARAVEHEQKIANPSQHTKDWDKMSSRQQQGLLNKWSKTVKNARDQKAILQGIKKLKSTKNPS